MTSVWGHNRLRQERPFVTLFDSSPPPELEFSEQPAGPLRAKLSVIVVSAAAFTVSKYTKKDLQQILKIILEAQVLAISEEPWDKPLKACFLDVDCGNSYMKCYNFC